jgi:hypothetical protein
MDLDDEDNIQQVKEQGGNLVNALPRHFYLTNIRLSRMEGGIHLSSYQVKGWSGRAVIQEAENFEKCFAASQLGANLFTSP